MYVRVGSCFVYFSICKAFNNKHESPNVFHSSTFSSSGSIIAFRLYMLCMSVQMWRVRHIPTVTGTSLYVCQNLHCISNMFVVLAYILCKVVKRRVSQLSYY